jgi:phage FluMu protein gp41
MYILRYYDFLNENKLYGKLVIDSLLSKFGSDSLNLINIFGLFRNTKPFSGKDIQKLSKDDLNTLYDE